MSEQQRKWGRAIPAGIAALLLALPASAANDSDRIADLEAKVNGLVEEIQRMRAEREAEKQVAAKSQSEAAKIIEEDVHLAKDPELQENIGVLAREIERIKRAIAVPEEGELKSVHGKGPAASKVYTKEQGLSIGGYGEGYFNAVVADKSGNDNVAEWLRGVLYVGYKFNDWIVFNSEYEFEHASTGANGSVSVEFAELDFLFDPRANVAVGLLLTPMGFINELHEPTEYYGVSRPSPEKQIIPSTWREIGTGLFGSFFDETLSYKLYAMNGLDAAGFASSGYRSGRQKGRATKANDWAVAARLDWIPWGGLLVGGSVWSGASGQNQTVSYYDESDVKQSTSLGNVWTTIFEVHAEYVWEGLQLRALYTQSHIGNAGQLTDALGQCHDAISGASNSDWQTADYSGCIAERSRGGYISAGYNILPWFLPNSQMRLEPFYRFEWTETQNKMPSGVQPYSYDNFRVHTVGLQFYPHPQVVIKADYRNVHALGRDTSNNQRPDEVQLGVGYVF